MMHLQMVTASLKTNRSHHSPCRSPREAAELVFQTIDSLWQDCSVYYCKIKHLFERSVVL